MCYVLYTIGALCKRTINNGHWRIQGGGAKGAPAPPPPLNSARRIPITYSLPHSHSRVVGVAQWLAPPPSPPPPPTKKKEFWIRQ